VTLIYYDGTHDLQRIKQADLPCFSRPKVFVDSGGLVVTNKLGKRKVELNLLEDLFKGQLSEQDVNYNEKKYIIEVELLDSVDNTVYLLKYVSFNKFNPKDYPKVFITVLQQLAAKNRILKL